MAPDIPAELQSKIAQYQSLGSQLQMTAAQRQQMEAMKSEAEQAVAALGDAPDDAQVWRSAGAIMVAEKDKATAETRLKDELETLEIRVKRFRDQETELRTQVESLQAEIQTALTQ